MDEARDMSRADFAEIPVVNVAALRGGRSVAIDQVTAEIVTACENAGFFYVVDHGVPAETIAAIFEAARWFFALPQGERDALDVSTSPNFRGYVPMGITGPNVPRRMLEAFQMMLELGPDDPEVRAGNVMRGPNRWPSNAPAFRAAMENYYSAVSDLSLRLLGAFARGLRLAEDYFQPLFSQAPDPVAPAPLSAAAAGFGRPRRRSAYRHRRLHDPPSGRCRRARGVQSLRPLDRRDADPRQLRHQHRRHDAALDQRPFRLDAA
jgi:hypothetical protein